MRSRRAWIWLLCCLCGSHGCGQVIQPRTELPAAGGRAWSVEPLRNWLKESPLAVRRKTPTHHKVWRGDLMVLPYADIQSDRVLLHNIRDCEYRTEEDYDVRYYHREILLSDVRTIDFIVVPFKESDALAHTMLSFGLANGEYVVFSVEARLEQGESYTAFGGSLNEYELIWLVGSERDLIRLRTEIRNVDVYLYPTNVTPQQAQAVFLAAVGRVNEIARTPEFYDTLTNNCTTNIVDLVNSIRPGKIPRDIRVLLPGHSDRLAHELGLLAAQGPFEQIKAGSRINMLARLNVDAEDFSAAIRPNR
jgi:hypothetical protein